MYHFNELFHYSETCIKRPCLGQKKVVFDGLLIEVKMHGKATIGT